LSNTQQLSSGSDNPAPLIFIARRTQTMTQKRTLKLASLSLLLIAIAAVFYGCGGSTAQTTKKETSTTTTQAQLVDVTAAPAVMRQLPRFFEATGSFAGDEQTDVAPAVGGKVVSVGFDLGSFVQKGQLLVQLDDRDARLRLEQAQAQVEQQQATVQQAEERLGLRPGQTFDPQRVAEVQSARVAYELAATQMKRFDRLIEAGDVSRSSYDQQKAQRDQLQQQYQAAITQARQNYAAIATAKAGVQSAQAQVDQAKKSIEDARVLAPISGFIAERTADPGEYVSTTAKVATIVRTNPLRVRIDIPEQAVPGIKVGQSVSVATSAFPDRNFNGRVARISPNVTANSRTLTVEAEVANPNNELKPGQFATIRILQSQTESAVLVPQRAVRTDGNVSRVFVIKDGRAEQRLVQVGQAEGDLVEIKSGVAADETVATSDVDQLSDGTPVRQ
jgi:multidrug efflux pump subunit AcrA (membrane-fusion protein)